MTKEEARSYIIRHCNPDYPKGKTEWERAINRAIKALEQPERQKGEWIPVEDDIPYGLLVECSKCGHRIIINDALEHNYCSECGADMRGEQYETD